MESLWNPPAKAEQSIEGWSISDRMDTTMAVAGIGFVGLLFGGVGVAIIVGGGSWFGLVFAGFGLLIILAMIRQARIVSRWRPGRLIFSEWPLEIGGSHQARYVRESRGGPIGTLNRIEARLELAEVVRYTVGTDTETDKEVVMTVPLESAGGVHGDRIEATLDVEIPGDGPPSLDLNNNRVEWWVILELDLSDAIDDDSRFKIQVATERR